MEILRSVWLMLQLVAGLWGFTFNSMPAPAADTGASVSTENIQTYQYNLDELHGWKVTSAGSGMFRADNAIYQTADSGKTWDKLSDSENGTLPSGPVGAFTFSSADNGWLTINTPQPGTQRLYTTGDGGAHWTQEKLEVPDQYASSMFDPAPPVFFSSTSYGIMIPDHTEIQNAQGGNTSFFLFFVTQDYGRHWNAITAPTAGTWNSLSWDAAEIQDKEYYSWEFRIGHALWTSPEGKAWTTSTETAHQRSSFHK